MFFSQTQPKPPLPPSSPPSVSRTIDEPGTVSKNGGANRKNLASDTITSAERNGDMSSPVKPGSEKPDDLFPEQKKPRKSGEEEKIMSYTTAQPSTAIPSTDTGAVASVLPPITSVTSSLGSIPAREGLRVVHVDPASILAGPSRSDEVKLDFDRTGYNKSSAQLLLQQKHSELLKKGYTTLIGKIAKRIDEEITTNQNTVSYVDKTETLGGKQVAFSPNPNRTDITSGTKTYKSIIQDMYDANECSPRTAFRILENLSKGYKEKRDYELFLNLHKNAQDLMAVLICEAIRFQEDGALERMAIRKVLSLFPKPSSSTSATASSSRTTERPIATDYSDVQPSGDVKENPFYKVFVLDENTTFEEATPLAIFAAVNDGKVGGKHRTLDLISGNSTGKNTHYNVDQQILLDTAGCLSDSEEQSTGSPHTPVKNQRTTSSGRISKTPAKFTETPSPQKTRSRELGKKR